MRHNQTTVILLLAVLAIELGAARMQGRTTTIRTHDAATTSTKRAAQPGGLVGSPCSIDAGFVRLSMQVLRIADSAGGSLSNGRWHLDIPAGVVDGAAAIGLGVPSRTSSSCQLDILSADRSHLRTPARLTVDCAAVPEEQLKSYVIYSFDPVTNSWKSVPGSTVDLTRKTVSAALLRFSTYAVGTFGGVAGS